MNKKPLSMVLTISLLVIILGSSFTILMDEPILPDTPYDYESLDLPTHFTTDAGGPLPTSINGIDNTPNDNPITNDGATLGRVLFYDKNLSANRTISCGSCHQPEAGFSDPAVLSIGFEGGTTQRHSMTLINARWYQRGRAFWDERAATIEEQVLMPFQDEVEMGLTLSELIDRVEEQNYYNDLFINAFGDATVTSERISRALAQFVRSIVSYQSKYDDGRAQVPMNGANFPNFTDQENEGKNLFFQTIPNGGGACFGCHTTEAFVSANPGPQNNGLDAMSTTDLGAGETFPQNPIFEGRFKTSTLRNIELTAPYMHDGRFSTLEEVVEHYNSGIQPHPTLSPALADDNGDPVRLNWTESQVEAVVSFLKTLTDNTLASEPKWADPFPVVLSVQYSDFSVQLEGQKARLVWQTAVGGNYKDFTIEKSLNASTWFSIGQQADTGFSNQRHQYEFWDKDLMGGIQYYRIRQTKMDGSITYSKTIHLEYSPVDNFSISIFPNPAKNWLSIHFDKVENIKICQLYIYNFQGQLVLEKIFHPATTNVIDISNLVHGSYVAHFQMGEQRLSRKFVKN